MAVIGYIAAKRALSLLYAKSCQMSTTDSTTFKLYFVLPATSADTARMRIHYSAILL
jgi:hypothetical protein